MIDNDSIPPTADASSSRRLRLGIDDFTYADLYEPARLIELAEAFYQELARADADLWLEFSRYLNARGKGFGERDESNLLVRVAPHLGSFLARLFGVEDERNVLIAKAQAEAVIFEFKKVCIQRRIRKMDAEEVLKAVARFQQLEDKVWELKKLHLEQSSLDADEELATARLWRAVNQNPTELEQLEKWLAALAVVAPNRIRNWSSWRQPQMLDYSHLVQIERPRGDLPELMTGPDFRLRRRDGFSLTDPRFTPREVLDEIHYCIYCHERDKDTCSKGFVEKDGSYRQNPLGIPLVGCPLDEKISEAHTVRRDGDALGALALIMIDNPMCPGTGHRICNDCMKACIFQKQDPVNIPQIETGILTDVLEMPWGVEVYALLTRWNPLNVERPCALAYNGKKVLGRYGTRRLYACSSPAQRRLRRYRDRRSQDRAPLGGTCR